MSKGAAVRASTAGMPDNRHMSAREIRYCTTEDGVSIAFAVEGDEARPPFLFIPGWISHLEIDAQARDRLGITPLLGGVRFITFDKRGTGLSTRAITDYSLDAHLRDVRAVVDAAGLGTFALAGWSEGGPVAIGYAARFPERVSRLTIIGSYADGSGVAGSPAMNQALLAAVKAEWGLGSKFMADLFVGADSYATADEFTAYQRIAANPAEAYGALQSAIALDARALLPLVQAPTLVLHTREDRAVPIECGQQIAAGIRGARFTSFPGAHVPAPDVWRQMHEAMVEFSAGAAAAPPPAAAPAGRGGLRTVLFTDLVGHTEMMQRLGDDRGRDVLREHERITRDLLKQHGGAEVKTMGDGFMASFASVTGAVDCAIALQRAFAGHSASMPEPLRVRVGLNAGEPIEEDGDLFGATVILASRIAAKADAGEILIPEPLRHLLSGKAYAYVDRGETALKGFDDAVRLYEVRWRE